MSENELDEILNTWAAPLVRPSLRERVRAGFRGAVGRSGRPVVRWFAVFAPRAAAVTAIGVFLLVLAKAAPLILHSPSAAGLYTVETENTDHQADGSTSVEVFSADYDAGGRRVPFTMSIPQDRFGTALADAEDLLHLIHNQLMGQSQAMAFIVAPLSGGCESTTGAARETILNYPTVAVQKSYPRGRNTVWMAPELNCFPLKWTWETRLPDGGYRIGTESRALAVRVNLRASGRL